MKEKQDINVSPRKSSGLSGFAERLRKLIPEGKLRSFARRIRISEGALRAWLAGRTEPRLSHLVALADALQVSVEWLATGLGDKDGNETVEFALVPQFDVEAGAGAGRFVEQEAEIGRLAFRREWIRKKGLSAKDLAVIRVTGDSMAPTIGDSALVLVDTRQERVREDGVYVLVADDHLVAKRLQRDLEGGGLFIRSDNPAYREQHVGEEAADNLWIVGRVVWAGHDV